MTEAADTTSATRATAASWPIRRAWTTAVTVVAVATSVFSSLTYYVFESSTPGTDDFFFSVRATLGLFTALGAAVVLVLRHQRPVLVTAIAVAPPLIFVADTLAALIALAALAARRRDRFLAAGAGLVFAATALTTGRDAARDPELSTVQMLFGPQDSTEPIDVPLIGVLLIAAALTAIPLAVGLWRGARIDLARRQRNEHDLRTDLARQDERSRIAREIHDVLGHRLSLLSLQAGALEVNDDTDGATVEAARTIRTTARESLDDLRHVIGVLRDGQTRPRPRHPPSAPRRTGSFRRLTNALRHAPGTTVGVTVRGAPDVGLTIEVVNPLPDGAPVSHAGGGTGLIGITERVSALDGTVSTGPTDDRTFAVTAWLPWPRVS